MFFEDYAKSNKFDPLNPDNWYSHPSHKITTEKVFLIPHIKKCFYNFFKKREPIECYHIIETVLPRHY